MATELRNDQCPKCHSDDIDGIDIDIIEPDKIVEKKYCLACGHEWDDHYVLEAQEWK